MFTGAPKFEGTTVVWPPHRDLVRRYAVRTELPNTFQEQLGLKLEATKAPADVAVIDKAEKPSEN